MLDNNKQEKTPFEKSQEGLNESIKTEIKQGEASTVNAVQKEIVQTKEQVVPIVQSDVVTTEKIQEVHERATPAPLVGKRIENVPFSLPRTRTLVEVRPIERAKWHGKAGQESFQRPKKFQVLVDTESMSYATGLTNEEIIGLNKIVNYNLTNHFNQETPHEFWDSPMGMFKMENRTM